MTIYIAGPMTGIVNDNREGFNEAEAFLKAKGHTALNPALLPRTLDDKKYLPICMAMLEAYVSRIPRDTLLSIRGQALSGDLIGAEVGLARILGEVPESCGSCSLFEGDCIICCHPPVVADQTPPDWCPKRSLKS